MPTYEYECAEGHIFEFRQSIKDLALTECKAIRSTLVCESEDLYSNSICGAACKRLISKTSFALKGPRWGRDQYGGSE